MAKRHPSRRHKKDDKRHDQDDAIIAGILEVSTWAKRNTQTVILFGLALALVVGGVIYYVNFQESLETQAVEQLEQLQQTVALGEPEAAKAQLEQYLDRFEGTPTAPEARLLLAKLYLDTDQPQQAVETLEASGLSVTAPLGAQLHTLLAKAYEAAEELSRAEETYLHVADQAELGFQRREALADAARLRSRQDNPSGAAELYEQILELLEQNDPERGVYQMRLAEARAEARG